MRAENYLKAFWGLIWANRPRYGGYIVHISVLLIAVGIIGSNAYDVEMEDTLMPGESMTINDYTLTYEGMDQFQTQSKMVVSATLSIYSEGKLIGRLVPEKHYHPLSEQWMTEVAIRSTPAEDLYAILVGWEEDGSTAFKVLVNPLVSWMWIGGGVMMAGGLIAFWPERRRLPAPGQTREGRK
jgi:cytochrome c-type biogenesis protein CcmF